MFQMGPNTVKFICLFLFFAAVAGSVFTVLWQRREGCLDRLEKLPPELGGGVAACQIFDNTCICADIAELRHKTNKVNQK